MKLDLTGKTAIVTGASQGIGKGCADCLAEAGAHVIVNGRNEAEGRKAVDSILAAGGSAEFLQGDMSRLDDIRRVFDRIGETHGKLDILVNNAGFNLFKGVLDTTPEDFDSIINLDLRGLFFATQAAVPLMKNAGADRWSTLPACMRSRPSATSPPTPPPRAVWSLSPVRYARNSARSASA